MLTQTSATVPIPQNQSLSLYENAGRALAALVRVDEVKDFRDKAVAMQAYSQQAKDRKLFDYAVDVRKRAEIRMGELLAEMADRGERAKAGDNQHNRQGGSNDVQLPPSLRELGISKIQSSRWQAEAALPKEKQEELIARAKDRAARIFEPVPRTARFQREPGEERPPAFTVYDVRTGEPCGQVVKVAPGRYEQYIEEPTDDGPQPWEAPQIWFVLCAPGEPYTPPVQSEKV